MKNYLKRNKPLLFLPLVLIPFIVLIFYVLGGGTKAEKLSQNQSMQDSVKGANYDLPEADRTLEIIDKTEGSFSSEEIVPSHDYNVLGGKSDSIPDSLSENLGDDADLYGSGENLHAGLEPEFNPGDPEELLKHIEKKQEQIRKELATGKAELTEYPKKNEHKTKETKQPEPFISETGIDELDQLFRQNVALAQRNDSLVYQLKQLQGIQEKQEAERKQFPSLEKADRSSFSPTEQTTSALKAEIYETTTVLTGNRVKLRLLEDGWLDGVKIPKGTFLYGTCEVAAERLRIAIRHIPENGNFIPVDISVYDLDGQAGLYVPDNAARKISKEVGSSTNTSSMFGVTNNPLTYAGIQAADRTAQSLLRLVRIRKVTIRKNTIVCLINKPK